MPDADDELAGGAVVLHVVVGRQHQLQAGIDAVHGVGPPVGRDRVEDLLKGRRNDPDRLVIRKYDPVIGRHVEFREER
jgi:hypothetical protein